MQIIDIDLVDDIPGPNTRPPTQSNTLWGIVLLSVLVHVGIVTSLSWSTPAPQETTAPPIKAVLIQLPAITPAPEIKQEVLLPAPEAVAEISEQLAEDAPQPNEEPAQQAKPVAEAVATETIPEPTPPAPGVTPEMTPEVTPEVTTDTSSILMQSDDSPAPASRSIRQSIGQSLQQQQLQVQQEMAEAAAQAYREQKNSPDLRIGEYQPKPEPTPGEHEINCDKGVNSSLAVVAGLFGGNVKCTQRNDFQQFIDKRLNKTHLDKD